MSQTTAASNNRARYSAAHTVGIRGPGSAKEGTIQLSWAGLVLVLSLFPYITFGPIGLPSQIQAWAPMAAFVGAFFLLFTKGLAINRFHAVLAVFAVILLIYIHDSSSVNFDQYFRKSAALAMSLGLIVIAQYIRVQTLITVIKFATVVWFMFAVLGLISPAAYLALTSQFVPGAQGAFGERGVTSLAPEATDFGFTMVYFWVLARMASAAARAKGLRPPPMWVLALIAINILLSRSGAGVIALVIVIALELLMFDNKNLINRSSLKNSSLASLAIFGLFAIALTVPSTEIRGFNLLITAISSPGELINTTFSYRLAHNLVGLHGFFDSYFLGNGAGTFTTEGIYVYHEYQISQYLGLEGWYRENVPRTLNDSPLAIFPVIIFEYGLLGVALIYILFREVLGSNLPYKFMVAGILLLTWSQSFPMAFPPFWLLLGLACNPHFQLSKIRGAKGHRGQAQAVPQRVYSAQT